MATPVKSAAPLQLNSCQQSALEMLQGRGNVFLTGSAGSGKSTLVRHFLREARGEGKAYPVLASTGAAAILVGGRTFHSFFGLGIMEGGVERTVDKALANKRLVKRITDTAGVVIDEISMISGTALRAAERIARAAREVDEPWGGLRVIAVGDFSQLPPVTPHSQARDWAFLDDAWLRSEFETSLLRTVERSRDPEFLSVLNQVRLGQVTREVSDFLNSRCLAVDEDFGGTRMFPLRKTTEDYNLRKLDTLSGKPTLFFTTYSGKAQSIEDLKRNAPIPESISLKDGALVMIRQNDPEGRWVNGSLGHVRGLHAEHLDIELHSGRTVEIEQTTFHLLDANGERVASATNFPVLLAYATTIHKAQGTTLDEVQVNLANLWEPGQAYVALSRVKSPKGLFIERWDARSIRVDPQVTRFYAEL